MRLPQFKPLCKYINASVLKWDKSVSYIMAQAPLKNTVADFWHMVWDSKTQLIIMVTPDKINEEKICQKYWETFFMEDCRVSVSQDGKTGKKNFPSTSGSTYQILIRSFVLSYESETRTVYHIQWINGNTVNALIPEMIKFVFGQTLSLREKQQLSGPTIVHCTTGTGLAGLVVALDILKRLGKEIENKQIDGEVTIDLLKLVDALVDPKDGRADAIANFSQYRFLYTILADLAKGIDNPQSIQIVQGKNRKNSHVQFLLIIKD